MTIFTHANLADEEVLATTARILNQQVSTETNRLNRATFSEQIKTRQHKLEKLYCENLMVKIKPPIDSQDIDWFVSFRKHHIVEPFRYETGFILLMSLIPVLGWMFLILRMHEMEQTKQFQEIENDFKQGVETIALSNTSQPK